MNSEKHKTTAVQHLGSKPTASMIANLALELSRQPDGAINVDLFSVNLDVAFDALWHVQKRIDAFIHEQ